MPRIDSVLVKEKIPRRNLALVFDDGDDIVQGIKQGMQKSGVKEGKVEYVEGKIKEGTVNCMDGHSYKRIDFKDKEIITASGTFKFGGGDLWGNLHIFTAGRKPISGTMLSGKAAKNFTLKISFVP